MLTPRRTPLAALRPALPAALALLLALGTGAVSSAAQAQPTADDTPGTGSLSRELYLVTLDGPGTAGYRGSLTAADYRTRQRSQQDDTLAAVGAGEPAYRWTTALNGVAVHLTRDQARALATTPGVTSVEPNAVRRLAGARDGARAPGSPRTTGGGEGIVVGVVDSGIWPESPLFTGHTGGPTNGRFRGSCEPAGSWPTDGCDAKLVGASWFVAGFGTDAVRSTASLSALDDSGHGTQVSSIAVGNAGVSVDAAGESMGTYSGVAPDAALAVYKACWTAPDPADDGCATADLVAAIDRATEDRVDVLNLSVAGGSSRDTVARALLGATEAGIVVSAAAGPGRSTQPPWVVSVGATTSAVRRGVARVVGGPRLTGAMLSRRTTRAAPLVLAGDAVAPGARRADARLCRPGSLDAGQVSGAVVLCARGGIGRIDKSLAVQRADGIAMVLVNPSGRDVAADFHSVPTVHLSAAAGRRLQRWLARHDDTRVALAPLPDARGRLRMAPFSPAGQGSDGADLVAPGVGVLGAVPPDDASGPRWDFLTGTSAAAAHVSGSAAVLLARGLTAAQVRSALVTSARPLRDTPVAQQGAGALQSEDAQRPGLSMTTPLPAYRAWLEAGLARGQEERALNLPTITFAPGQRQTTRRVTNTGSRALYFSSSARGFERHGVLVTPAALRLGPGESATFRVRLDRPAVAGRRDDGYVVWRGANGTRAGVPVLVAP